MCALVRPLGALDTGLVGALRAAEGVLAMTPDEKCDDARLQPLCSATPSVHTAPPGAEAGAPAKRRRRARAVRDGSAVLDRPMPPGAATAPAPVPTRTLRLAYLTNQYPAVSHTFIRRELREIERRGHSVLRLSIRTAANPPVDPEDLAEMGRTFVCLSQPKLRAARLLLRSIRSRPLGFIRAAAAAWRMSRRSDRGLVRHLAYLAEAALLCPVLEREGVQHVHVHFATNAAAVARLLHLMGGPTYSLVCHGSVEWDEPRQLDVAGKVADSLFVTAISSFSAAQVRRWSRRADWPKVHIVRCGIGSGFERPAPPISPASRTLVAVGRLAPEKGPLLLVEAFAQALTDLPNRTEPRLVLVGDGPLRADIERRARELGVRDQIELTGWVGDDEVRRRIMESRALVLSSFAEGLPVVIMEAMALGRPVLSTYIGGIPELVVPGENGWLVPAGDVEATAAALRQILTAPVQQLNAMGRSGRRAVQRRHSTRKEGDRLEQLFLRYVGRNG